MRKSEDADSSFDNIIRLWVSLIINRLVLIILGVVSVVLGALILIRTESKLLSIFALCIPRYFIWCLTITAGIIAVFAALSLIFDDD